MIDIPDDKVQEAQDIIATTLEMVTGLPALTAAALVTLISTECITRILRFCADAGSKEWELETLARNVSASHQNMHQKCLKQLFGDE